MKEENGVRDYEKEFGYPLNHFRMRSLSGIEESQLVYTVDRFYTNQNQEFIKKKLESDKDKTQLGDFMLQ